MKKFLFSIFNSARNISLILVVGFFVLFLLISLNDRLSRTLFDLLNTQDTLKTKNIDEQQKEDFDEMSIKELSSNVLNDKKFKIKVKGGNAYLRPMQIMYIQSGSLMELFTTDEEVILNPTMKLFELDSLLNNQMDCFFKTKSALINYHYVLQLLMESSTYGDKYSYQAIVIMEDGKRISISKSKSKELFELLNKYSF